MISQCFFRTNSHYPKDEWSQSSVTGSPYGAYAHFLWICLLVCQLYLHYITRGSNTTLMNTDVHNPEQNVFKQNSTEYNRAYKFPSYRAGEVAQQAKVGATVPDYLSSPQKFVTNRSPPQFYVTRDSTENSAFCFSVAI